MKYILQHEGIRTMLRLTFRNIFVFFILVKGSINNPSPSKHGGNKKWKKGLELLLWISFLDAQSDFQASTRPKGFKEDMSSI